MKTIPRGQTPERKAYMKAWHAANPRDRKEYKKTYDAAHKEIHAEKYRANQEQLSAKAKARYQKNRQPALERAKAYLASNKESVLEYQRNYYIRNSELVKKRVAKYQKANRMRMNCLRSRRRTKEKANGGSHTLDELVAKFALLGNVCFYCGCGGKMTIDHDVPVSRGGTDFIDNILPACRSCNSKKNNKTAQEFLARTNHTKTGGVGGTDSR